MLPLIALPILSAREQYVWGSIRIPNAGVSATVYTTAHEDDCGCIPALWNGGRVIAHADLSDVMEYDMVYLTSYAGDKLVLECVEIIECLSIGDLLISSSGCVSPDGDVLLCAGVGSGPVMRVYRLIRL